MPKSVFGAPFQDRQVYPGAGDVGQWNQDEGSKGHGGSVDGEAFTSGKNAYSKTKEDPALKTPMKGDRQQSSPQTGAIFYQRTLLAGQNGEKDPDTVGKGKAGDKFGAPKGRQFDALLQSPLSENRLEEFGKTRESAVAAEKFNIHYQSSGDEEDKKARMQE